MKTTRDDLIRKWRSDVGNYGVDKSDFEEMEQRTGFGNQSGSMEATWKEFLADTPEINSEKMTAKEVLDKVEFWWNQRNERIIELEDALEEANRDVENMELYADYVRWLEEKLEDQTL